MTHKIVLECNGSWSLKTEQNTVTSFATILFLSFRNFFWYFKDSDQPMLQELFWSSQKQPAVSNRISTEVES
jgi:hypothetical protein